MNLQPGSTVYFKPNEPDLPEYPGTILALRPHSPDVFIEFDWIEAEQLNLPELTYPDSSRITTDVISIFQIKSERIDF